MTAPDLAALVTRIKADRTIADTTKLALLFLLDPQVRQTVSDLCWAQIEGENNSRLVK